MIDNIAKMGNICCSVLFVSCDIDIVDAVFLHIQIAIIPIYIHYCVSLFLKLYVINDIQVGEIFC